MFFLCVKMMIAKLKKPYYLEGHVGVWAVLSIDLKSLGWKTFFPLWGSGSNGGWGGGRQLW